MIAAAALVVVVVVVVVVAVERWRRKACRCTRKSRSCCASRGTREDRRGSLCKLIMCCMCELIFE